MQLELTDAEVDVLRDVIDTDIRELVMEIANTDHRDFRDELKARVGILEGVRDKLSAG